MRLSRKRHVLVLLAIVACIASLAYLCRLCWLVHDDIRRFEVLGTLPKRYDAVHTLNTTKLRLLTNHHHNTVAITDKASLRNKYLSSKVTGVQVSLSTSHGYVLAGHYWEQQSSACRNLQNLQCWAAMFNLSVVEPYMTLSLMKTPFTAFPHDVLRFGDLFDLESWNRQSMELGHSKVVPWNQFIEKAPRNVTVVKFKHPSKEMLAKNNIRTQFAAINPLSRFVSNSNNLGCDEDSNDWPQSYETNYMARNNFKIVRTACINFQQNSYMELETFNELVYGQFHPSETVVYFREWRGMGRPPRIAVPNESCENCTVHETMAPNKRVVAAAQAYIDRYLNGGDYIAIMARIEKAKISLRHQEGVVPYCFTETLNQWRTLRNVSGVQTTFLAADIGKYGSHTLLSSRDSVRTEFRKFFKQIYGTSMTVEEWESTFERETDSTDSGYVALLQKLIVTRSKCVLFVGGGAFQKHALNMYRQLHTDNECISVVKECTDPKRLPL